MTLEDTTLLSSETVSHSEVVCQKNKLSNKAFCYSHHGEILQGVFAGNEGQWHNGLITLPCPLFYSNAQFIPSFENDELVCFDPSKWKSKKAAKLVLEKYKCKYKGGFLKLNSSIPVSWGLGSSTCDVITTIYAIANSYALKLTKHEVAKLAVETEIASDSTMFSDEVVLFAQREGIVLETFIGNLPPLSILGCNCDPNLNGIDTLSINIINYSETEKNIFQELRTNFRTALLTQDLKLLGKIATTSAIINQRYFPKPFFNQILELAEMTHALGVQISHSGNVIGILYDPSFPGLDLKLKEAELGLSKLGIKKTYHFNTVFR